MPWGATSGQKWLCPGRPNRSCGIRALSFILFGDEARIQPVLARHRRLSERTRVVHTIAVIGMDDKPSQALRRGKGSSMWLALEAVQNGRGGFRGLGRQHRRADGDGQAAAADRSPGIERPAIAALWPTVESRCIVLDVGANIGATARQLCDFALMGAAMARALFQHRAADRRPAECRRRGDQGRRRSQAGARLAQGDAGSADRLSGLRRRRPDRPGRGRCRGGRRVRRQYRAKDRRRHRQADRQPISKRHDVVAAWPRSARCWPRAAFSAQAQMDPRRVNGGTFLGLNGIVIKSHGGTDALGFASAIELGYDMAERGSSTRSPPIWRRFTASSTRNDSSGDEPAPVRQASRRARARRRVDRRETRENAWRSFDPSSEASAPICRSAC